MVQPSSVDVRLDKFFRLFDNHKYPVIDPAQDQADLTRLVEVDRPRAFVLHPGEFVLGSTLETVALPDDLAARVEGKSAWAASACSPTRPPGSSTPASTVTSPSSCPTSRPCRSCCGPA